MLDHPFFQCTELLFSFVSFRDEVETGQLLMRALELGKTVAVPRVVGENQMEFHRIGTLSDLSPGFRGIPEPDSDPTTLVHPPEFSPGAALMLLPGAAFDPAGNRIGYGKGFYDSYLHRYPYFYKLGLAFSVQLTDEIPADPYDVKVDEILTESDVFHTEQLPFLKEEQKYGNKFTS